MSNIQTLYVGNDTVFEITKLKNDIDGLFINDADVTVTISAAGSEEGVDGDTWPKTVGYVEDSEGVYRCSLPHELELVAGQRYAAAVVVDGGSGLYASFTVDCVARARG